jgi:hypothetical protein
MVICSSILPPQGTVVYFVRSFSGNGRCRVVPFGQSAARNAVDGQNFLSNFRRSAYQHSLGIPVRRSFGATYSGE